MTEDTMKAFSAKYISLESAQTSKIRRRETMTPRKIKYCVKLCVLMIIIAVILLIIKGIVTQRQMWDTTSLNENDKINSPNKNRLGYVNFNVEEGTLTFQDTNDNVYLRINSVVSVSDEKGNVIQAKRTDLDQGANCPLGTDKDKGKRKCLEYMESLDGLVEEFNANDSKCFIVKYYSLENKDNVLPIVEHCIDMEENWYGGGILSEQRWPLNRVNVASQPFVTTPFNISTRCEANSAQFGSFLEPYFVSASGVAVIFNDSLPLFISMNYKQDKKLCFKAEYQKPYQSLRSLHQVLLEYKVCKGRSARDIHETLLNSKLIYHPLAKPSSDILQNPVWGTRGVDLDNMNERELVRYITNLKTSNLSFSLLMIDGNYTRFPGSVFFNEKKFPRSAQLVMELDSKLSDKRLKVITEIHPLVPNITQWKQYSIPNAHSANVNFLDLSNAEAVNWFISQLEEVRKEVHVQGFHFSGGHAASFLKSQGMSSLQMKRLRHPNQITNEYGKLSANFQGNSFISSGFRTQAFGLVADSGPSLDTWNHCKGLKSVIPTIITLGILGYPFNSVGPIGGVTYLKDSLSGQFSIPDRNLFVRWLQLSSFLPVMEFSVGPWHYDNQLVNYTRTILDYRQKVLWPKYLYPAVNEAIAKGTPIIRPLWWIAPKDKTAQFIDCEFMVGDDLLVAPVLDQGQLGRQVYLPEGHRWQDQLRDGAVHLGGQWLRDYGVERFEVAHFVRLPPAVEEPGTEE